MINLLPLKEKELLAQEERGRLVLIWGALVLVFLVSLSLVLFSVKIYISGQVESQEILVKLEEEEFKSSQFQKLEEELNLINQNLGKTNSFYRGLANWTGILEKISDTVSEEIYLTNLSLKPVSSEKEFLVSLTGFSPTREVLFEFKKRLEAESGFKDIYFPPSNWVRPKDVDFSITFEIEL